ncbi:uncharacterized protein YebE (UPF0316 family) [Paenibacillus sp. DS2015]|uniref:hypothetical protein n=1 Tax=Paenibacillus sp. DS2015 TaxID=3373917 RepID=UPI003D20EE86
MINPIVIFIIIIVLILLLDWRVLRTLPSSNRWLACSVLILSLAIFVWAVIYEDSIRPTVWIARIIERWAPFD